MNLLDVSHPTHNLLFYIYISSDQSWMYESRLCNKYIKWLDAFIDFTKKDMTVITKKHIILTHTRVELSCYRILI
jgi:hypothetical protein